MHERRHFRETIDSTGTYATEGVKVSSMNDVTSRGWKGVVSSL